MTTRTCSFPECDRIHRRNGWCNAHDLQRKRWGVENMAPLGETPRIRKGKHIRSDKYFAVHKRLRRWFGPASDHKCKHCEKQAREWAYKGHSKEPKHQDFPGWGVVEYSSNLEDYMPLCKACHVKYDTKTRKT